MEPVIDPVLEQQYNNRAAVPDHPAYLHGWSERSELYRTKTNGHLNISYGADERQILDVFPVEPRSAPVHIFIHGGYWQALNKDSFSFIAEHFNRQGECAVILNYGLCPMVSMPVITEQINQAICWVVENIHLYGGNAESMQITGHSAGGHLLARLITQDWAVNSWSNPLFQRANALSGLYDLQRLVNTSINNALGLDESGAYALSPLYQHPAATCASTAVRLFVGELESNEYKWQSEKLVNAWQTDIDVEYTKIPASHHFSIVDDFLNGYYESLSIT